MTEKDILSKLGVHEKAVTGIVDKHRAAATKLQSELTAAENTLANYETMPTADTVTAALAAQSTADNAKRIIARLGPIERRELSLRDQYVVQHSTELIALVVSLQAVRTAPREAFRKSIAAKLGPLLAAVSLDPNDWPAHKQVEDLQKVADAPEFRLDRAGAALRDFRNQPTHANFQNAKEAILRIEYPA